MPGAWHSCHPELVEGGARADGRVVLGAQNRGGQPATNGFAQNMLVRVRGCRAVEADGGCATPFGGARDRVYLPSRDSRWQDTEPPAWVSRKRGRLVQALI